jgi:hypothetical protein
MLVGNSYRTIKAKKKQIVDKVAYGLKDKYGKLFSEKGYDMKVLEGDLNKIISDQGVESFEYNRDTLSRIEKCILQKLTKMESVENKAGVDMKKVTALIKKEVDPIDKSKGAEDNKDNKDNKDRDNKPVTLGQVVKPEVKDKEWAEIVRNNYSKHLEDESERKRKELEKKLEMRRMLDEQIKEKFQNKIIEKKESDSSFIMVQREVPPERLRSRSPVYKKSPRVLGESPMKLDNNILKEIEKNDKQVIDRMKGLKDELAMVTRGIRANEEVGGIKPIGKFEEENGHKGVNKPKGK